MEQAVANPRNASEVNRRVILRIPIWRNVEIVQEFLQEKELFEGKFLREKGTGQESGVIKSVSRERV